MFKTGSPVKGADFIDRKKHLPIFKAYLENNQHVMIKAPRRFGKTSLVKHVFEHESNYTYIYVDLRRATNLKLLANQIIEKAYSFVGIDNFFYQFKKSITGLLKSIQKVKIDDIGEITLQYLEKDEIDEVEYFLHAMEIVETIAAKKNIKIKFVFDEFQDILRIADNFILEQLRSVIQHHENVTYIFLGSIETIMTKIFEDKTSSFFHFARVMPLSGLDVNELYEYTKELLNTLKVNYDESLYNFLFFLQGHPDYSAQFLQSLYFKIKIEDIKIIDNELCIDTLKNSIIENRAYLEELIMKAKQKKHHYEALLSIANNKVIKLNSKTLYSVHSSLEDMGLIKKIDRANYIINDIFLNILLQQKDDENIIIEIDRHNK
ncbi:hypothetical protein CP985_13530 [Malaciobacter mytili LMG 24559]|uniref:ATP-binding protein n=1 Tax=Malaciobacter mytili LMG 24559 TaxID=1032238 RepID=A0AAX2ADF5_9BACT|nr:ATP-binding protein [Malaciobacter mytili]AXH16468.1 ATP-binding protein (AAA domain) [Malaciobacter mytili LMG 24559]RXK12971.1 hypothetical protein CP985_13530 [Malaciobacter mytili LMG 24559]